MANHLDFGKKYLNRYALTGSAITPSGDDMMSNDLSQTDGEKYDLV